MIIQPISVMISVGGTYISDICVHSAEIRNMHHAATLKVRLKGVNNKLGDSIPTGSDS